LSETATKDISVVVPVYNSEGTLNELFERVKQTCTTYQWSFEVVFVDDRSRDKSWAVLKQLKLQYPEYITAVKLAKNSGQHSALMCGFNYISGNWVVTIDDDLQNPPEDIVNLVTCQRDTRADIIYGIYQKGAKKHSIIRNIGSIVLRKILENATGSVREASAFRLVNAKIIRQIRKHHQTHLYIDQILSWYSQNTATTLVQHLERQVGESGYNYSKLVSFTVGILINYTVLPLRFITMIGLGASFISFLLGLYYIGRKLFWGINTPGFTTIIVAITLSAGLILFCMGIIGEYIARIYVSQSNKPIYSVERII
jgi:undecaprenyl-phosphate 4-deoxy-4-formamido-L-arabinose transferase